MITIYKNPSPADYEQLLARPEVDPTSLKAQVQPILDQVKLEGDVALKKFNKQFDYSDTVELRVSKQAIEEASLLLSDELKSAINLAYQNILKFHESQIKQEEVVETQPGVKCWRKSIGIEKVGLYIPGGTAPLFSTILMLGIPAKLAGCKQVVLCTPVKDNQAINPAILYTANLVGIDAIFQVGGAQAIAAMAFGTATIPKCYKIFGPGNQYVTCAKMLVNQLGTAIDMPAGPSELAVIVDEQANPAFVAADLLSQAEHGADSQVMLFTTNESLIAPIVDEIQNQLEALPRKAIAIKALKNSKAIVLENEETLVDIVNEYACEHLIINTKNNNELAAKITNAGSIFLGNYSPESAGDYASGTNHTLPTSGFAKAYSGVSVDSFVKKITYQELSAAGLQNIGSAIELMAEAELLVAHKNAVSIRLKALKDDN